MITSRKTSSQVCCVVGCGDPIAKYNFCAVHLHYSDVQVRTLSGKVIEVVTVKKDSGSRKLLYNSLMHEIRIDKRGLYIIVGGVDPIFQTFLTNLEYGFKI